MALDFGTGVSRTLDAAMRQFSTVVFQEGKPPLDSEVNLQGFLHTDTVARLVRAEMPSGFFLDPTRALQDYLFNSAWSNYFSLGNPRTAKGSLDGSEKTPIVWANVNGWIIPIMGTDISTEGDLTNLIKLYPPPESDSRIDFVFLEAWQCRVDPNPSEVNKPSASKIWKYGNVKYGGTNLTDDLQDPAIGFETTGRIQIQYRLRVYGQGVGLGSSVNLDLYPDGLGDPNILGQGTASSPVGGYAFSNMREELGDPSLWRAGNGNPNNDLGTVDGYTYAIPVCAVFRRNSNVYVAVSQSGNPNQNGAFNRLPGTKYLPNPLTGDKALTTATLTNMLSSTAGSSSDATISITDLNGSGLEDSYHVLSSVFLVIDDEIVGISAVDLVNNTITIPAGGRGRYGTAAVGHQAGSVVSFYNSRPDGLYADQIAETDVLDLRRAVNATDWDFGRLLVHNIGALAKGNLRTAWKKSGSGDTQGVMAHEVDYLYADGSTDVPNHTEALDGPDGIRTVWSDAATYEPNITVLLDNDAAQDAGSVGFTSATFDATTEWDVGPDFHPSGFMNVAGMAASNVFANGSSIFLFLGGDDGTKGARGTFRDGSTRAVRAIMPQEFWRSGYPVVEPTVGNQYPVTVRFVNRRAHEPAPADLTASLLERHPGPMYPWRESNFERPFIVLGGLLRSDLRVTGISAADLTSTGGSWPFGTHEIDVDIDFDTSGVYYLKDSDGNFVNDPTQVTHPLLRDSRTLYGMLTGEGRDSTGASSEVYLVVYGDDADRNNNGAFRILGAGTVGYTSHNASNSTSLVVAPLNEDFTQFNSVTGKTVTVEFRSQEHNADDTSSHDSGIADYVISLTDIGGYSTDAVDNYPWRRSSLGDGEAYDNSMPVDASTNYAAVPDKMLIGLGLMYHPGRSGTARVPDDIVRFAMKGGVSETLGAYLRQSPATIDTTFSAVSGAPDNETFWDPVHVQLWNRLPGYGWFAPDAPSYGGEIVGYTESDREHELFYDRGSKSFIFRPFRDREMTLQALTFPTSGLPVDKCLIGGYTYPSTVAKDGLLLFTYTTGQETSSGKRMGFAVPREFMPRFGRQDIPYWVDINNGAGPFLPGINHLFRDTATLTSLVFNIIGGESSHGAPEVNPLFFTTDDPSHYGSSGTVIDSTNNRPHYKARKTTDIDSSCTDAPGVIAALRAVNSSDFGKGLKGIQLPPYLGIARLYGVYDARDFESKGGRTFKVNRYEMDDDPAPNLLKEDADQQTLYILQDGAKDLTHEDDDHTYIIPSNVLDITRALNYQEGDVFEDYDYVIELTAFGFAKGFINKNNFVLVRRYDGAGNENTDGDDSQLEGIHMIVPCAAGYNDQLYTAYNRTVYQGDPYMSRKGDTTMESDYEHRYGQLSIGAQYELRTPIQQFDSDGNFVPQTPNARVFEVLSAMDFYTTLGTGKIGGTLYAGTPLDVGYTQDTADAALRAPDDDDAHAWRILPRTFTEGQKVNTNRAQASVEIVNNDSLEWANDYGDAYIVKFTLLDDTVVKLYAILQADLSAFATQGVSTSDMFFIDTSSKNVEGVFAANLDFGTMSPGSDAVKELALNYTTYPELTDLGDYTYSLQVTPPDDFSNDYGGVVFDAYYDGTPGQIKVRAVYTGNPNPYEKFPDGDGRNVRTHTWDIPNLAPNAAAEELVTWTGASDLPVDSVVAISWKNNAASQLIITAQVNTVNQIRIRAHNPNAGAVNPGSTDFLLTVLKDVTPSDLEVSSVSGDFIIEVSREGGDKSETAANLVELINNHADLQSSVKAFNDGGPKVTLQAVPTGEEGNGIHVEVALEDVYSKAGTKPTPLAVQEVLRLSTVYPNTWPVGAKITGTNFVGGEDLLVNAGNGTSQLALTGMTERLPLGAALQDSDFLCENPLGDDASAMHTRPVGPRPIQTLVPLTTDGEEFERFLGEPGSLLAMSDGSVSVLNFGAWTSETPTGSRIYRIFRGGGPVYVMSGDNPGGPVDWVSETFPTAQTPVLKGGVLVCRALLVRNFYEEANPAGGPTKTTDGDEIQMVVITHGILGPGQTQKNGITLDGVISPSGYGEGFASADRYRIGGRPMFRGFNRETPDPSAIQIAVYPDGQRELPSSSGGSCP